MTAALTAGDKLRAQRDRFLAFAFAGADMLVEISATAQITFAAGVTEKVVGWSGDDLDGRDFLAVIHDSDRVMIAEALRRLRAGSRLERLRVDFLNGETAVPCFVSAINRRAEDGVLHLSVSRNRTPEERRSSGPMSVERFASLASERVLEAKRGGEFYNVTFLSVSEEGERNAAMMDAIQGTLRAWSVGGDSIALLDNGALGIIHDAAVDTPSLEGRLRETLDEFDRDGLSSLRLGTLPLDADLGTQDLSKALVYIVNKFAENSETFDIASLSHGYKAAMSETLTKVANFRSVIGGSQFCFAFQPIVCMNRWTTHHYEALGRIAQGGRHVLPSHFVSFAEDVGIVHELDWVVCKKAMQVLRDNAGIPPASHLAINLSGQSLTNHRFVGDLILLLRENRWQIPRLLIEITESAEIDNLVEANKVVQALRGLGCRFCLDDFGAGAATFHYLRALTVDFVKIDGSYILDAFDTRHGKPFLRAMVSLCMDLGIRTIGEMVEEEKAVHLLREIQVNYGQGYYFAKPAADASHLSLPPKPFGRVPGHVSVGPPRRLPD